MRKYELSMTKDYVSSWGYKEGIRELFQNALDQQTTVEDNDMRWSYDMRHEVLYISNPKSSIHVSSLLLGASTKANDSSTIGQFGEGYKVGTLALIRDGKTVRFFNHNEGEVWNPRFVKSRRYGCDILTFFVDRQKNEYVCNPKHTEGVAVKIIGITAEEFAEIKEMCLFMQEPGEILEADRYGDILLNPEYKRKLFVNGLLIETSSHSLGYGYNFKPKYVKLDRDRRTVKSYDLINTTSYMWGINVHSDHIMPLITGKAADIGWLHYNVHGKNAVDIKKKTYDAFVEEYGVGAIPVISQKEWDDVSKRFPSAKVVYVGETQYNLINACSDYQPQEPEKTVHEVTIEEFDNCIKALYEVLGEAGKEPENPAMKAMLALEEAVSRLERREIK